MQKATTGHNSSEKKLSRSRQELPRLQPPMTNREMTWRKAPRSHGLVGWHRDIFSPMGIKIITSRTPRWEVMDTGRPITRALGMKSWGAWLWYQGKVLPGHGHAQVSLCHTRGTRAGPGCSESCCARARKWCWKSVCILSALVRLQVWLWMISIISFLLPRQILSIQEKDTEKKCLVNRQGMYYMRLQWGGEE